MSTSDSETGLSGSSPAGAREGGLPLGLAGWALILGASSGFGEAIALELARRGMDILGVHLDRRSTMPNVERITAGEQSPVHLGNRVVPLDPEIEPRQLEDRDVDEGRHRPVDIEVELGRLVLREQGFHFLQRQSCCHFTYLLMSAPRPIERSDLIPKPTRSDEPVRFGWPL